MTKGICDLRKLELTQVVNKHLSQFCNKMRKSL